MNDPNTEEIKTEVFYYVNYVNVNYSVKNSAVDCKYSLYFYKFPDGFLKQSVFILAFFAVLVLIL